MLEIDAAPLRRLYGRLRGSQSGLVALALITGLGAGLGAIVFRALIGGFTMLFTGLADPGGGGHPVNPALPWLGPWFIVAVPVAGGLLYGPLIDRFAREARGHGVPEVMLAVAERGGRIRPRVAVVKALASAICMGAGGSVGREGPIVQIGSALGSAIGQRLHVSEANLRLLVACGASAGISATFNAPIAGVFFSLELILRDFEVRSFGAVVLASVAAAVVGRAAFGSAAFLPLPPFQIVSVWEYALYAGLGLLAAVVGVAFIRVLYGTEDLLDRIWGARPEWLRPIVGGLALGLLLLALPELYGVGYSPLEQAVKGDTGLGLVLVLLAGKLVATSLTIGIGGSGGVFAPSLFMGGMLGSAFGIVANALWPGQVAPVGAYGLVGMGAVFAGAARAPITAVLILFELTADYQIILPMMLAIAVAAGVSTVISADSIYTLKLRRRGIDIRRGRGANLMELITVGDAMRPVPKPLESSVSIGAIADRFARDDVEALPVIKAGRYVGLVPFDALEDALRSNAFDLTAAELIQDAAPVRPTDTLEHALQQLVLTAATAVAVVGTDNGHLVGWLTHHDILAAYVSRLGGRATETSVRRRARLGSRTSLAWLGDLQVLDLEVGSSIDVEGRALSELAWPPFTMPIAIRRGRERLAPTESLVLLSGDRLTMLASKLAAGQISDWFTRPASDQAAATSR